MSSGEIFLRNLNVTLTHFRIINKELPDYVHYLVCDSEVIVCGFESGEVTAFQADTVEQIYVS